MPFTRILRDRCALIVLACSPLIGQVAYADPANDSNTNMEPYVTVLHAEPFPSLLAQSIFGFGNAKARAYGDLSTGEQAHGIAVVLTAAHITSGVLGEELATDEQADWLAFIALGGELTLFQDAGTQEAKLISAFPALDPEEATHAKMDQGQVNSDWFRDFLESLIDALDRIGDPDGYPETSPDDSAPAAEPEDNTEGEEEEGDVDGFPIDEIY